MQDIFLADYSFSHKANPPTILPPALADYHELDSSSVMRTSRFTACIRAVNGWLFVNRIFNSSP